MDIIGGIVVTVVGTALASIAVYHYKEWHKKKQIPFAEAVDVKRRLPGEASTQRSASTAVKISDGNRASQKTVWRLKLHHEDPAAALASGKTRDWLSGGEKSATF